jgi:hypothetical protein
MGDLGYWNGGGGAIGLQCALSLGRAGEVGANSVGSSLTGTSIMDWSLGRRPVELMGFSGLKERRAPGSRR